MLLIPYGLGLVLFFGRHGRRFRDWERWAEARGTAFDLLSYAVLAALAVIYPVVWILIEVGRFPSAPEPDDHSHS